jgi:hypothetical protein
VTAAGQLSLFTDPATNGNSYHDDLFEAVRRLVAEPGMSAEEVRAVVADALGELGWTPESPLRPAPCSCTRRLVLPPGSTCLWCGRPPRVPDGPVYRAPVGPTPLNEKHL